MKVIIIENELYLAQSIATKLDQYNYETEIYTSVKEAINTTADIYLLSTTIPNQNPIKLIEKFKNKIILLMVNYINNDTVGNPLKAGAKDYIVKPFVIEELVRKMEHYYEYNRLKKENKFLKELLENIFNEIEAEIDIESVTLPITIYSNFQRVADKAALMLSEKKKKVLTYISLAKSDWKDKISALDDRKIAYITNIDKLKKDEREKLFEMLEGKKVIISSLKETVSTPYNSITINASNKLYDQNNILTINEYVQYIIKNFQHQYPDTELSKKLGISRKSLWEKRRKFELFKKK
jgi:DNA-binding NtrC family response regulator